MPIRSAARASPSQSIEFASSILTKQSCNVTMSRNKLESFALRDGLNLSLLLFCLGISTYPVDNTFLCLVCRGLLFSVGGGGDGNLEGNKKSSIPLTGGGDGERCLTRLTKFEFRDCLASTTGLIIMGGLDPDSPGANGGEGERLLPAYHMPLEFSSSTGSSIDNVGGVE